MIDEGGELGLLFQRLNTIEFHSIKLYSTHKGVRVSPIASKIPQLGLIQYATP